MRFGTTLAAGAVFALLATASSIAAEDKVEHYAAVPSETIEEAVDNFVEYNAKVRDVLSRDPLAVADMEEIHEYTYTIELALAKINEEFGALAATLETLHLASEAYNEEEVRGVAEVYFETADALDKGR
ncbi:DUF6746 family protein [Afifella pfennigii]|uniref:DUF6746 family protein n=1 Tax=Afifella pfennigii TaxID=209897 RepID=UPI000551182A|nr:DUF6746 family protein [Afifella pfennigii]